MSVIYKPLKYRVVPLLFIFIGSFYVGFREVITDGLSFIQAYPDF